MTEEIPVVGLREPCPCGSGKRYKACHGKARNREAVAHVARPFEGLASECDWVAFREIVPAATAPLTLRDGTAFYRTYAKGAKDDPAQVVYQASIADTTRACTKNDHRAG